jgi:hypothetical protein
LLAKAEWTKLDENDRATIYIDMNRLQKNAQFATIWQLTDLKKRSKTGTLSNQVLMEFDCKGHKRRTVVFTSHDENMAAMTMLRNSFACFGGGGRDKIPEFEADAEAVKSPIATGAPERIPAFNDSAERALEATSKTAGRSRGARGLKATAAAATACHECAAVPGTQVAASSCTVGTTQLTSPTSVEPAPGTSITSGMTLVIFSSGFGTNCGDFCNCSANARSITKSAPSGTVQPT